MKGTKKIVSLGLASAMVLGSTVSVLALPGNTVVIGDKAFSMDYFFQPTLTAEITDAIADGGDIYFDIDDGTNFIDAWSTTGATISAEKKAALKNIEYTDFTGNKNVYANFDDTTPIEQQQLTIKSATALNATSVEVTFSNDAKYTVTGLTLVAGPNTISFTYQGQSFTREVTYTPPVIAAPTFDKVEFINYRSFKVYFKGLVDKDSAKNPANYYFEIESGNAGIGDMPTLKESNQLNKIETNYKTGAAKWWSDNPMTAEYVKIGDVDYTEVSVFLPEDARFTNVKDDESIDDAERTLAVRMQTSKTGPVTLKELIKEKTVNVAARNVLDASKKFIVNTEVKPMLILDQTRPELMVVRKVANPEGVGPVYSSLGRELGTYNLLRSDKQEGEKLEFVYSEPVFDAHDLDKSDPERVRDIQLYVGGNRVAALSDGNLDQYVTFRMDKDATYEDSKVVSINVEKAVKDTVRELFAVGLEYQIRFVGVTDLAGNIEQSSEHSFAVKFYDATVNPGTIVKPVVENIVQVADNVFRVEFNRSDVQGTLSIKNPDGEGTGELRVAIPKSTQSANKHYYSYVAVYATDDETNASYPPGIYQNAYLSYDKQSRIYRDISVEDIRVENDAVAKGKVIGDNKFFNSVEIVNDVLAPVALNPDKVSYDSRGTKIDIPVKDITPWVDDENIDYWVSPIAYSYNASSARFGNEIAADQSNADTYLPVKVSYTDSKGAVHQAMVSNRDLRPDSPDSADLNPGAPGNITFINDILTLDLSKYPQLLDSDKKLVAGATYKVELPRGYFTDSTLDMSFGDDIDFSFHGNDYDMMYVDVGRDDTKYHWVIKRWSLQKVYDDAGLGFTSSEQILNVAVDPKPADPVPPQYVPQTSMKLINYDEATKSLKIEFTGTIDVDTLKNKANYSFDGKTLAQWDALLQTNTVVDYVVNNSDPNNIRQYAMFVVPQDSIKEFGDYSFRVEGVAHPLGAKMTPVDTVVKLYDNYRPIVTKAVVTGSSQIKLTFNEPIQYFVDSAIKADPDSTAKNFKVTIGNTPWTVQSAVLPSGGDNDREVILNLGNEIPATGDITVEIVKDQNNNILVIDKSTGKNPMKTAIYSVTRP